MNKIYHSISVGDKVIYVRNKILFGKIVRIRETHNFCGIKYDQFQVDFSVFHSRDEYYEFDTYWINWFVVHDPQNKITYNGETLVQVRDDLSCHPVQLLAKFTGSFEPKIIEAFDKYNSQTKHYSDCWQHRLQFIKNTSGTTEIWCHRDFFDAFKRIILAIK